ncbi:MAG: MBL fold metallo-hydrolase [Clostridia bacterium]|nr:MBL fold metallo-hydrolase [Clostridia bacterium]
MIMKHFITDLLDANVYLFTKNHKCFMVDCGGTPESTRYQLENIGWWPDYLLLTHGHYDHISALDLFSNGKTRIVIHSEDAKYLNDPQYNLSGMLMGKDTCFEIETDDGDFLKNEYGIYMLHTPGHSPGSVCYAVDDVLFTGDTLFCNGIGNTAFPGGNYAQEIDSVQKLLSLEINYKVCPGHGPATYLFDERKSF